MGRLRLSLTSTGHHERMLGNMRVLAINCGSSSLKSAIIDPDARSHLVDVRIEGVGRGESQLRVEGGPVRQLSVADPDAAVRAILDALRAQGGTSARLDAVAHRVVHGGTQFTQPTLIDDEVERAIESLSALAPLHNPPALAAIRAARALLPDIPHVAVFDTAFHATLPKRAREYALPIGLARQLGIRRYGFHGTNHAHVARTVAEHLGTTPESLRIISCHLGNGSSLAAIEYGRSVETSMGMTPLEGLVMGTRAGDLDPGVILHLLGQGGYDVAALETLLNRQSGLTGLTGTEDLREIERRAAEGDESCRLAIAVFSHRVRKYIGAYAAVMNGVDAIAFTGGIGENSALMRHRIAQRLDFLGATLDEDRNRESRVDLARPVADISAATSRAKLLVVRADEELGMACEAALLLRCRHVPAGPAAIPVAISARHAHLSQATIDRLFGPGYRLRMKCPLVQPGHFAAEETVTLIGPAGRIEGVRLLGPPREEDQVEISRTDEFTLGVDAPVRLSGDLANTPGITIEGPAGRVTLPRGLICARRHIHMSPEEAERLGLKDHDVVEVAIDSEGRDLVFGDVVVRVSPDYRLELHLDTDEGNAAGLHARDSAWLLGPTGASARLCERRISGHVQ